MAWDSEKMTIKLRVVLLVYLLSAAAGGENYRNIDSTPLLGGQGE